MPVITAFRGKKEREEGCLEPPGYIFFSWNALKRFFLNDSFM
jgi:hypothetical protein